MYTKFYAAYIYIYICFLIKAVYFHKQFSYSVCHVSVQRMLQNISWLFVFLNCSLWKYVTVKTIFWWHKFLPFSIAIDILLKWCLIQFCNVSDCHSSVNNPEVAWDSQIYNPKHFMNNLLISAAMHGNDIWLVITVLCV